MRLFFARRQQNGARGRHRQTALSRSVAELRRLAAHHRHAGLLDILEISIAAFQAAT